MSCPSLADKRAVDESKPTRIVALIFVDDVLEDLPFKFCRNTPPVLVSHLLNRYVGGIDARRLGREVMNRPFDSQNHAREDIQTIQR